MTTPNTARPLSALDLGVDAGYRDLVRKKKDAARALVDTYEQRVRSSHAAALQALTTGDAAAIDEALANARRDAAAATREAKKAGDPDLATHAAWMKNGIASMARVLAKRQAKQARPRS